MSAVADFEDGGRNRLKTHSLEAVALGRYYRGISFVTIDLAGARVDQLVRPDCDFDLVGITLTVRGDSDTLIETGFMHPDWQAVAPGGYRRHSTKGFGRAEVYLRRRTQYTLCNLMLDNVLDLIAPAVYPMYRRTVTT